MFEQKAFVEGDGTGSFTAASRSSAFDELSLSAFGAGLKRIFLPGGQILFRENEVADSLYVVISGCLGVVVRANDGRDVLVARIPAGETVGEMGLFDGGTRSATVEALRDTELLKFDKASCEDQLLRDPRSMHALMSLLVRRLRKTTHPENRTTLPSRTVAVVPLALDVDHRRVASDLHKQLSGDGQRATLLDCISADSGRTSVSVKQIVCFSLHQRPRPSRRHLGLPVKFNRSAGRLILYCFTTAAAATCKPRTGGSSCRSTLFVTPAPEM
jgi:CRP-like cAMP-binding protein